jgi:sortase (surface protein transpeptidase)
MDQTPVSGGRSGRWRVSVALLVIVALALGAAGWARHDPASSPASSPASRGITAAVEPLGPLPEPAPGTRPTSVEISSIDVSARIKPMGLNPDRTVEVPDDPDVVGWYRLGSMPGQSGSAVLLGHVDSKLGPAVFARLRQLAPGSEVRVLGSDGTSALFEVRTTSTYPNEDFPALKVYRSDGRPSIALVTCGGRYDATRGGYQANVVVYADLVSTTSPTPAS